MKMKLMLGMVAGLVLGTAAAVEPGEMAPEFTLTNTKGEEVSLSDYKGKTVVLEWINYDCPFVAKHYNSGNLPMLQEKYTDKGVVWLAINSSAEGKQGHLSPSELQARADKEGSKATAVLLDTDGQVGKAYGAKTTPHMFVINGDGKIAYAGAIDDKPTTAKEDIQGAKNYVSSALESMMAGEAIEVSKAAPYGCSVKY